MSCLDDNTRPVKRCLITPRSITWSCHATPMRRRGYNGPHHITLVSYRLMYIHCESKMHRLYSPNFDRFSKYFHREGKIAILLFQKCGLFSEGGACSHTDTQLDLHYNVLIAWSFFKQTHKYICNK